MSVTLDNYWLVKVYEVKGEPFTFLWGITALGWDDALKQLAKNPTDHRHLDKDSIMFKDGGSECMIVKSSQQPEIMTEKFSVRDDQIRKPMPKQINFKL